MTDGFIGAVINGYEVLSLIGVGGMARVYMARQQSMNRQVALKVLPQQFASDDTYLQRFNREVKIVSQLEHAHIVPVYDYGEHEGQPYIVMRYMPSGSVDDLLNNGPLELKTIGSVLSQIAPALDYAHSKGVLHRDLKPSNVLLDETGSAFLSDFGIARLNEGKGSTITTQGVVGTPSYMSPEQAQGKEMDGRSDIYSLGVMLFELATGRRPFEADTPYSIAVMQVTTPPPSPRAMNPLLPQSVERVILRALRKNPDERPPTAVALAEEWQQALQTANHDDTDPKLKLAQVYAPAQPQPQPVPISSTPAPSYAQQPVMPTRYAPMPSASYPRLIKPERGRPWLGVVVGGGLGCLVLLILVGIALVAVNFLLPQRTATPAAATDDAIALPSNAPASQAPTGSGFPTRAGSSATATPTLDATSEAARATLLARQRGNDATMTAAVPTPTQAGGASGSSNTANVVNSLSSSLRGAAGSILFAGQSGSSGSFQVTRIDLATGRLTLLTDDQSDNTYPIASPDGRWIAFQSDRDGDFEIYVMNTMGGQLQKLTDNTYLDRIPAWSPDGEWVIYSADVRGDGSFDLLRTRLDGSATEVVLSDSSRKSHARYSPDGRYIVYTTGSDLNNSRTWEIALLDTQTGQTRNLTNNTTRDASPVFSPDGSRIMYITYLGENTNAIAIMNADGSDQRILYDGGANIWAAHYSPDGAYIVFTRYDGVTDELYLMTADGQFAQQLTRQGGSYGTWYGG
jgi:serine/threonine protein kinase/Tol biopolymer transport system component